MLCFDPAADTPPPAYQAHDENPSNNISMGQGSGGGATHHQAMDTTMPSPTGRFTYCISSTGIA